MGEGDPRHRLHRPAADHPGPGPPPRRGRRRPGARRRSEVAAGDRGRVSRRHEHGDRGIGAHVDDRGPRPLEGRLVLLGVTGSIAAYKAAELARALIAAGAEVQVAMTHSAAQFIGPAHARDADPAHGPARPAGAAARLAHRPHRGRRHGRPGPRRAGHRALDGGHGRRPGRRRRHRHLPGDHGAGRRRAGHGRRHVGASGHARQRRHAAQLRLHHRRAGGRPARLGRRWVVGAWPRRRRIVAAAHAAVAGRPIRVADPALRPPLAPDGRGQDLDGCKIVVSAGGTASPSTRSASSATARPAGWASPSPRRRSTAARA